jgi:hypothetical protein
MPVLGVDDRRTGLRRAADLLVHEGHDPLAAADVQAALGVGEVVLDVATRAP